MSGLYLGIDTSNYKTSVAVTDSDGNTVFERSEYLAVPGGSRGMRQSEAFFRHSCRLPDYFDEVFSTVSASDVCAVGVSSRPRRVEGSYMPCFLAGVNAARETASVLGIPLHEFSHQEGHAAAVIDGSSQDASILFHLSGGTTEFLLCRPDEKGFDLRISGGTKDISIGQLVDRAGVAMGYSFPSGMYLDALSEEYLSGDAPDGIKPGLPRIKTDGYSFNLSGTETRVLRWIETASAEEYPFIAYSIFDRIAELLAASAVKISSDNDIRTVYMAGGVSASSFLRRSVLHKLSDTEHNSDDIPDIIFGEPSLSGDNAVGIARLTHRINTANENCYCYTGK